VLLWDTIINKGSRGNKGMANTSSITTAFRGIKAIENNIFKMLMNH